MFLRLSNWTKQNSVASRNLKVRDSPSLTVHILNRESKATLVHLA